MNRRSRIQSFFVLNSRSIPIQSFFVLNSRSVLIQSFFVLNSRSVLIQSGKAPSKLREGPSRCGFSLIEMLAIISLAGVLSLVGAKLLTLFLEVDAAVATDAAVLLNLERLEDRFRSDVHAALRATLAAADAGGQTLTLDAPEGRVIRYLSDQETVVREVLGDAQVLSRDRFVFADGAVRFEVRFPLVQFTVQPAAGGLFRDVSRTAHESRAEARNKASAEAVEEQAKIAPQENVLPRTLNRSQRVSALLNWNHRFGTSIEQIEEQ